MSRKGLGGGGLALVCPRGVCPPQDMACWCLLSLGVGSFAEIPRVGAVTVASAVGQVQENSPAQQAGLEPYLLHHHHWALATGEAP